MPLAQKILLVVPTVPLLIIILVLTVGLSFLGLVIVRRIVPGHVLKTHNELTGAIFEVVAMAYAVLLAFVVIVSWQNYDKAKSYVETEANSLVDLHRASAAFPRATNDQIRALLKNYAEIVVAEEWKSLARGEESMNARAALRKVWDLYTSYEPKTEKEKIFLAESVSKLVTLREMRRLRIVESRTGVHPALWFILIIGGITTITFTLFFGAESFTAHAIMASTLAVTIVLILYTILLFDYPFTGSVCVNPEMFQQLINY